MTYREAENFLFNQFSDFSKYGQKAYNPGLQNISELCLAFENPHLKLQCIHVAGTNGKGSVCHLLCSVLMEQGYKVGLFTSPHLIDFRERIQVNGQYISKNFIINFLKKLSQKSFTNKPSFFEITTCLAWCYFVHEKVDYVVLETGLGGRLDSTNLINPILSVITNIGLDHAEILGNSRQKIAVEKCGIIKKDKPCVIGETDAVVQPIFSQYNKLAPLVYAQKNFNVEKYFDTNQQNKFIVFNKKTKVKSIYKCGLFGSYQVKNMATVLTTVACLKSLKIKISTSAIKNGLEKIHKNCPLNGRWQILNTNPHIIIDVAHNPEGSKYLLKDLKNIHGNKKYIFMGTSAEKDFTKMIATFPKSYYFYFSKANNPRAIDPKLLHLKALELKKPNTYFEQINTAWKELKSILNKDDLVIITGSIFFVNDWLKIYGKHKF